jgi:hypothetical protein
MPPLSLFIHAVVHVIGMLAATCSSDQKIKIWDYNETEGIWESNISFRASIVKDEE